MLANYWQEGKNLDYNNETDQAIKANTVIKLKDMVGIAGTDIAAGGLGSVVVHGVFEMEKTAGSEAIELGQKVYFDGTGITHAKDDGGDPVVEYTPAGYAAAPALDSATTILVKLLG